DFLDRTQRDMGDLIKQMDEVRIEVTDMRQIVQHVPHPAFQRGGMGRHCDRGRHH
ncbi:hypothetical protein A2U01_0115561, partial [Trifolium medium]|nr:hypothetical protein [Trifolium medium]